MPLDIAPPPLPGLDGEHRESRCSWLFIKAAGPGEGDGCLSQLCSPPGKLRTEPTALTGVKTTRCWDGTVPNHPLANKKKVIPATVQATALTNSCAKWCNYHLSCQMASRWSYLSHQRFNKLLGVTFAACPPPEQPSGL